MFLSFIYLCLTILFKYVFYLILRLVGVIGAKDKELLLKMAGCRGLVANPCSVFTH